MSSKSKKRSKERVHACTSLSESACYEEQYPERKELLTKYRNLLNKIDLSIFTSGVRLGIVLLLLKMESACVCELQYALDDTRQPLLSHHLREMKKLGLLKSEKWKKWMFYSLSEEIKLPLSKLLSELC